MSGFANSGHIYMKCHLYYYFVWLYYRIVGFLKYINSVIFVNVVDLSTLKR